MNIVNTLYLNRSEKRSISMAKYMKNNFPFLGISRPERDKLQKSFLKESKRLKAIVWVFVFKCWNLPEREFQYLALDYLIALKNNLTENDIEKLEKLIINKSWWDTVDVLSTKLVGHMFSEFPEMIDDYIPRWSSNENIWLKRTAILFQLKYKEQTNTKLLEDIILENKDTNEFFVNKAVGWALREYSKVDPDWVKNFLKNNTLHPLSVREGSKYI